LRVLAGRQPPLAGKLATGHGARTGYYDQDTAELDPESTPYGLVRRAHDALTDLEIRSHLARFLFRGGERARVAIALLLLERVTWLALDEPTNHLDLGARTALEEMLGEFDGALVCVSHDREFLDGLCTHVLEVAEKVELFTGNYSAWRAAKLARRAAAANARTQKPPPARGTVRPNDPPPAARRRGRSRNSFLFEKLEARIIELERELAELHAEIATEAVYRDVAKLKDVQIRIAEREHELALANEEWANWEQA
jgi:ATP-binding cassette subfamily F protein 3